MVKGSRSIYHIRRTWQLKDLDQAPYVDVISYVWEPFGTKSTRPNSTLLLSSAGFSTVNLNTSPQITGFLASPPASQPSSGAPCKPRNPLHIIIAAKCERCICSIKCRKQCTYWDRPCDHRIQYAPLAVVERTL